VVIFNSFINIKLHGMLKTKKEVGMKKIIVVMLALFLAVPAITYAGSATSKWDLVVGGQVKFDMGYNTQSIGSTVNGAQRDSLRSNQNGVAEYGSYFMGSGESELSFLIKGPDAWGGKTMAYVSGDFIGNWSGVAYGTFNLKFAFIKIDWKDFTLDIGQHPTTIATLPTWSGNTFDFTTVTPYNKGAPTSQNVMLTQRFGKNWSIDYGLVSGGTYTGSPAGSTGVTTFTNSKIPSVAGDINYTSDTCGKVGPWQLFFSLGGLLGSEKRSRVSQVAALNTPQRWEDADVKSWIVEAKAVVPIIPQKKEDKTGAFLAAVSGFTGQNTGNNLNLAPMSYTYGTLNNIGASAPTISGGYGHLQYYLTNNVWLNGFYGLYGINWSSAQGGAFGAAPAIKNYQQIIANIMYDVNPALRVGFEYGNFNVRWTGPALCAADQYYDSRGSNNMFRVGAIYFF
jgi:hypothetical protein